MNKCRYLPPYRIDAAKRGPVFQVLWRRMPVRIVWIHKNFRTLKAAQEFGDYLLEAELADLNDLIIDDEMTTF